MGVDIPPGQQRPQQCDAPWCRVQLSPRRYAGQHRPSDSDQTTDSVCKGPPPSNVPFTLLAELNSVEHRYLEVPVGKSLRFSCKICLQEVLRDYPRNLPSVNFSRQLFDFPLFIPDLPLCKSEAFLGIFLRQTLQPRVCIREIPLEASDLP